MMWYSILRTAWLAWRIWTPPISWKFDDTDQFDCISLRLALVVAWGIWKPEAL